jgi:hypothetical protein
LQEIDEKDCQILLELAVEPARTFALPAMPPNPLPKILTIVAPDEGKFVCRTDDEIGAL